MKLSRLSWSSLLLSCLSSSTTNTVWALTSNLPQDPQFFDHLCDDSGGDRPHCKENHVQVDVPAKCVVDGGSDCPILFYFHGAGGTNAWFSKLSDVHDNNFIGVYPQGEDGWNTGPKNSNSCDWNDFECKEDPNETQFIYNIIDGLRSEGASGNVYLIGNSNGAALTYRVAVNAHVNYGIKGIIAKVTQLLAEPKQSGPGPNNYNVIQDMSTPKISVLNIMGSDDQVIPYEGGSSPVFGTHEEFQLMDAYESIAAWSNHNGCTATPITSDFVTDYGTGVGTKYEFQNCLEGTRVMHYNIDGAGHNAGGATIDGEKVDYTIIYEFIQDLEDGTSSPPPPPAPAPTPPAPAPNPTPTTGGACTDDPNWHGKHGTAHNCAYVAENLLRCNWKNEAGEKAQEKCQVTCDPDCEETECTDDPDWRGKFNEKHNCEYVANNPSVRCGWKNSNDETADQKCPVTCDTC